MSLYIPVNIKKRKEIIDGCGMKELFYIGLSLAVGVLIGIVIYMIKPDIFFIIIPAFISPFFTYSFTRKNNYGQSTVDIIKLLLRYIMSQKKYMYSYRNIYERKTNGEE